LPSGLRMRTLFEQRSSMAASWRGSAAGATQSPPLRQQYKRPLHGAFCFSGRVRWRMRTLFGQFEGTGKQRHFKPECNWQTCDSVKDLATSSWLKRRLGLRTNLTEFGDFPT